MTKKVLIVFGTRPEAIKMAPLIKKISGISSLQIIVCVSAQHREMLDMVLELFKIEPDYDLNLMSSRQSLTDITVRVLNGLEEVLIREKPDLVLVQGDTTTTMAAAMAAFYQKIPVGHVEAGLRSGNLYSPYPEEMNRRIASNISTLHFAPTEGNRDNLLKSGINPELIYVTGNTGIDALHMVIRENYNFSDPHLKLLDFEFKKVILLTAHRRENWGSPMKNILKAVKKILDNNPQVELVFPVHMNPQLKKLAYKIFSSCPQAHLIEPLDYASFVNLMAKSYLVLTDSGGLQEEAPALGKPVLVLRSETERPEAVQAGTVKLTGIDAENIFKDTKILLDDHHEYLNMAKAVNPYGDGHSSDRITKILTNWLCGHE